MPPLFVITGGPGSGKSTLIAALAETGLATMPEAGRAIIRDQQAIGGTALPWADRAAFAELMLGWELRSHAEAQAQTAPVVFDRGVPDVIGYLTLCGLPVPPHMHRAAALYRYNPTVFLAPFWADIYATDTERRQSHAEAEATAAAMITAYEAAGYRVVPLPRAPVAHRVAFVRAEIDRISGT
ncbi:putative ATPase [Sphingomonas zeicaulis]|uniref:AAA family ATPase n=1 Tax=Sphingomonas zeicaulis TaxID=1632740 RepID=UPI003D23AF33